MIKVGDKIYWKYKSRNEPLHEGVLAFEDGDAVCIMAYDYEYDNFAIDGMLSFYKHLILARNDIEMISRTR